ALDELRAADDAQQIEQRIGLMTERFREQVALYLALGGATWEIADHTIFTINLLSDAILLEQGWLPTNELNGALLEQLTGIKAKLLRAFTNTNIVGGWNVSWQRPKPTEVAVTMGNVFVFQAAAPLDPQACERLAQLQFDGIGE